MATQSTLVGSVGRRVHLQQTRNLAEHQSLLDCFEKSKDDLVQPSSEPKKQVRELPRGKKEGSPAEHGHCACEAWWPRRDIPDHLTADARDEMILDWSRENGGPKRISKETIRRGIAQFRKNGLH